MNLKLPPAVIAYYNLPVMMTDTKKINVPEPVRRLGEVFAGAGQELYLVGGFVRDYLMGRPTKDVDATTGAHPGQIKRLLKPHARHLWTVGERFGTIGAEMDGYSVEVTTYRSDLYTRGSRHPEVRFGNNLTEDLARRDFTVNSIAADARTGDILDPFGGREDLKAAVLRSVGDPVDRMRDDPLRMLRAVRFETTLSSSEQPFAIAPNLEKAILENAQWLENISAERIREEFERILLSENVAHGIRALVRLGLMRYILPEFLETLAVSQDAEFHHKDVYEHTLIVVSNTPPDPVLRKAALFHDIGKPRTLVYEHRCTFCGARSLHKTSDEGECRECGGRTVPKKIHFYGHENVGAAMARRAMQRLAYPKDDIDSVVHLISNHMRPMSYAAGQDPWTDSAVRRFIRDTHLSRGDTELANVDMLLQLARADITGSSPRRRGIAEESWRSLKDRVDEVREQDQIEQLTSPLDGTELMQHFGRGPGRWIKEVKDYLEGEVIEGRLGQDDKERAWEMAEAYAREHELFG